MRTSSASAATPGGGVSAAVLATAMCEGIAYGAHVWPLPFARPYRAYIASFSSTSSEVWRESRKYFSPSATTSLRIASSRASRSSASDGHAAAA